ncbi:MAG: ABC transporter permease subunit [Bacteroidia bacterium]|nr:ABC transporter permease subunit [Bacteroidia bacterium]
MYKILTYSFFDLIRSRWLFIYCGFYLVLVTGLFLVSSDPSKVIISMMNVVLLLVPLIATLFGVMYYYNSREFSELLLAQPIPRAHIFLGQYLGIAASLSLSLIVGLGIPFLFYGLIGSGQMGNYLTLVLAGVFLSFIFSGLAFLVALRFENRIKGFGVAILVWLFFAVIYDGILLIIMALYSDYPLERFALGASVFNPVDLSRILILMKLDLSALMGLTGAVFKKILGTGPGFWAAWLSLVLWVVLPTLGIRFTSLNKDF